MPSLEQSFVPGVIVAGRYRVERVLTTRGPPLTVLALDEKSQQLVVLAATRFLREAKLAAQLTGAHVVRGLDTGQLDDAVAYLVCERLRGVDLSAYVQRHGALSLPMAVDVILQACAGLAEAHARGLVHRSLQPSHLFLMAEENGRSRVKLLDVGLTSPFPSSERERPTGEPLTAPPRVSSPEQQSGAQLDSRSDIWSLGVTLFWLLTMKSPFEAGSATPVPLTRHLPHAPGPLQAVLSGCLQRDPKKRYPDVLELARALDPFRSPDGLGSAELVSTAAQAAMRTLPRTFADDTASEPMVNDALRIRSGELKPPVPDEPHDFPPPPVASGPHDLAPVLQRPRVDATTEKQADPFDDHPTRESAQAPVELAPPPGHEADPNAPDANTVRPDGRLTAAMVAAAVDADEPTHSQTGPRPAPPVMKAPSRPPAAPGVATPGSPPTELNEWRPNPGAHKRSVWLTLLAILVAAGALGAMAMMLLERFRTP